MELPIPQRLLLLSNIPLRFSTANPFEKLPLKFLCPVINSTSLGSQEEMSNFRCNLISQCNFCFHFLFSFIFSVRSGDGDRKSVMQKRLSCRTWVLNFKANLCEVYSFVRSFVCAYGVTCNGYLPSPGVQCGEKVMSFIRKMNGMKSNHKDLVKNSREYMC